jgi:predicted HNH restriction endonuclease
MSTWEEDIVKALESLGGSAEYDSIYQKVQCMRPNLPQSWKQIIRRIIQDKSSDSDGYKSGSDIFYAVNGIGGGYWGLRSHLKETPHAEDLHSNGTEKPLRVESTTYRILRDTELARKIKLLYKNQCQICGYTIKLPNGNNYSEAHHIIPLGQPHNGSDTAENIIVLCPNHHAMLDYGVIELKLTNILQNREHKISEKNISYHNNKIFKH